MNIIILFIITIYFFIKYKLIECYKGDDNFTKHTTVQSINPLPVNIEHPVYIPINNLFKSHILLLKKSIELPKEYYEQYKLLPINSNYTIQSERFNLDKQLGDAYIKIINDDRDNPSGYNSYETSQGK